jgi:ribosomal protein S18 acetylase RimI-like enzyme
MTLTMTSAAELSVSELAELFNESFTGYIAGNVHFDRDSLLAILTRDNTDLLLSRILMRDEKRLGMMLIARQGWTSRVAAMGIIPEAQNQGLGKWFLGQVIDEARARGERTLVLEAFEQNTPAVALYKRMGFTIVRRLMGYDASSLEGLTAPDLQEIDIYDMARIVVQHGLPNLPWQVSGTAIARTGAPNRAYQLGHAYALISNPNAETVILRALIVEPEFRRQGEATRLIHALAAQFPDKKWVVVQIWPEEYTEPFLPRLGFVAKTLNQVQMQLDL